MGLHNIPWTRCALCIRMPASWRMRWENLFPAQREPHALWKHWGGCDLSRLQTQTSDDSEWYTVLIYYDIESKFRRNASSSECSDTSDPLMNWFTSSKPLFSCRGLYHMARDKVLSKCTSPQLSAEQDPIARNNRALVIKVVRCRWVRSLEARSGWNMLEHPKISWELFGGVFPSIGHVDFGSAVWQCERCLNVWRWPLARRRVCKKTS